MAASYEFKSRQKKTSEPPWMTDWIRSLIVDRRKVYKTDGDRLARWKLMKGRIQRMVQKSKTGYHEYVIEKFSNQTDLSNF